MSNERLMKLGRGLVLSLGPLLIIQNATPAFLACSAYDFVNTGILGRPFKMSLTAQMTFLKI